MPPTDFTVSLLRASAGGFAGLAVSRTAERRRDGGELEGGFDAWQAHFKRLLGELAAAADDGGVESFVKTVGWTRDAFTARGLSTELLSMGLEELAAVLEESLPATAWKPLPPYFAAARSELVRDGRPEEPDGSGELVATYLARLHEGDAPGAIAAITDAVASGTLSVPDALDDLTTAMHEVGRRWHTDEIDVAQEHFATQITGRLLERLFLMARVSPPNGHTVALTMIEGDAHDLGLRIVAALFELDGWRTVCLGANMPTCDLPRAVDAFGVDLIVLGATLNTHRDTVGRAVAALRATHPDLKILVGGPAFEGCEERATEIGADGCALRPRRALELGHEVLAP